MEGNDCTVCAAACSMADDDDDVVFIQRIQ
jgi:hypothetical protein